MLFSSLEFLYLFLPLSVALYFALPQRFRNLALLCESLIFYVYGEIRLLWVMLGVMALNFTAGLIISRGRAKKATLITCVSLDVAILAFFKYTDFFLENIGAKPLGIILPLGISFYIFQAMSYVIDVYKGAVAQKSAISFGAYITMFPQLVAGPIVRYGEVERELSERHTRISDVSEGLKMFAVGLGKKVLLANGAGNIRNIFLSSGEGYISLVGRWLALVLFAFQIYYDFGGYSDMAVGLGRIFGFHFPRNFDYPSISKSVTEFCRRWHITLSTWFREYVYIPLGGNRCSRGRMYLNLFITWLLTGIWHGAEWCFVVWGLYFFFLLVLEKAFWGRILKRLPASIQRVYALLAILFGWFIFTFEGGVGIAELGYLFGIGVDSFADGFALYELLRQWVWIALMAIGATPIPKRLWIRLKTDLPKLCEAIEAVAAPACIFLCTVRLSADSYNPFLYFRF